MIEIWTLILKYGKMKVCQTRWKHSNHIFILSHTKVENIQYLCDLSDVSLMWVNIKEKVAFRINYPKFKCCQILFVSSQINISKYLTTARNLLKSSLYVGWAKRSLWLSFYLSVTAGFFFFLICNSFLNHMNEGQGSDLQHVLYPLQTLKSKDNAFFQDLY